MRGKSGAECKSPRAHRSAHLAVISVVVESHGTKGVKKEKDKRCSGAC